MFPSIPTYAISPDLRSIDFNSGLCGIRSLSFSWLLNIAHAVMLQHKSSNSSV